MVVYLYRWKIKAGKEKQFQENWAKVTLILREKGGSYGSRLHITDNGEWIGYAQWPSIEARENSDITTPELELARTLMKEAVEMRYPDLCLEVKEDLLIQP